MKLKRVTFRGFGRFKNREFFFKPGINVIEAPNEAGKSTLLRGILALLYGLKKEGVKKQLKAEGYERYLPWDKSTYGGEMVYTVRDHVYRLVRSFTFPQEKAQLTDLSKEKDITDDFPLDVKKDRLFLENQIAFSGEAFQRIAYLFPHQVETKDEKEKQIQMIEKMKRALYGQDLDALSVIKELDKKIHEIGNTKSDSKKYGMTVKKWMKLEKEIDELKKEYGRNMTNIQRLSEIDNQIKVLQQKRKICKEKKTEEVNEKIQELKHANHALFQLNEKEAYHKISLLEEFSRMETDNLAFYEEEKVMENVEESVELQQLIKKQKNTYRWISGSILLFILILACAVFEPSIWVISSIPFFSGVYHVYIQGQLMIEIDGIRNDSAVKSHATNAKREKMLKENEEQLEGIHEGVKKWLLAYSDHIPPFDPEKWIEEIRLLIKKRETTSKELYRLELMRSTMGGFVQIQYVEEGSIEEALLTKKEDRAKLTGRIERTAELLSQLPEKEEELLSVKRQLRELEEERRAYVCAKEVLMEVIAGVQENMGPKLIPRAKELLKKISDDRYTELLIRLNKGIDIDLFVPETGESQPMRMLSRGTVDQVIFALRISLLEFYASHCGIFLPLILDDYFVHFDEVRIKRALQLLKGFSAKHQIILSTCHERERKVLDQLDIPYHFVKL